MGWAHYAKQTQDYQQRKYMFPRPPHATHIFIGEWGAGQGPKQNEAKQNVEGGEASKKEIIGPISQISWKLDRNPNLALKYSQEMGSF